MTKKPTSSHDSLIPVPQIPAGGEAFSQKVHGLLDGQPKDSGTVEKAFEGFDTVFDAIAAGLYNLASMLIGEGEESVGLVETTISTAEISPGDARQTRMSSRRALCTAAIRILEKRVPGSLATPLQPTSVSTCIEDDDLDAAGATGEELEMMLAGPDRDRVRDWLASLSTATRVIFVLRAVAGFSSSEAVAMLVDYGGPEAAGWTAEAVREHFRQGLCSLASQLIHASTAR
jgi:DNA-directed RNA polymerase specialized sigma24 family protein